jgi:hypothetical protein
MCGSYENLAQAFSKVKSKAIYLFTSKAVAFLLQIVTSVMLPSQ